MKKKRFVIATTTGFHLRHLARELIKMGEDVTFLSYLPDWKVASYGIPRVNHRSYFPPLFPTSVFALARQFGRAIQTRAVEQMLLKTDEAIARSLPECDVFVGLSSMAIASARMAKSRYGALVLIDRGAQHVLGQAALLGTGPRHRLSQFYIDRELGSYDQADVLLIPSIHVEKSFLDQNFSPSKLFVNTYGVDTDLFRQMPGKERGRKVAFAGGWSYQKGCDVLSEAIKLLPSYQFHHFGSAGDVGFPVTPNFISHGHLPQQRLAPMLARCDVLVLPSRQDGFGMVILEALSAGLTVVASTKTAGPDMRAFDFDEKSLILIEPGNVQSLVAGLRAAFSANANEASPTHTFARHQHQLSWRGYAERFLDFVASRSDAPLVSFG